MREEVESDVKQSASFDLENGADLLVFVLRKPENILMELAKRSGNRSLLILSARFLD